MKRRNLSLIYMLSLMVGTAGLIVSVSNSVGNVVRGTEFDYSLVLNSSNKVTSSGEHSTYTTGGYEVKFTYSDVASSTTGHVTLNNGGSLSNKTQITSINGLNVKFDGHLQAKTSYDAKTWSPYFDLVSETPYSLDSNPYYIELYANSGSTTITGVTYSYTCVVNPNVIVGTGDYIKVTDPSQLVVGSKVVFTNSSGTVAMSTTQNENNRGQTSVTVSNNKLTINSNVQEFLLCEGNTTNSFAFKDETRNGYLAAASSSSNVMHTDTTLSNESSFDVTLSSGNLKFQSKGSYSKNKIRYNSSSSLFSMYSSGQGEVSLYQSQSNEAPVDEVGFIATDSNASNYKNSDIFDVTNGLVVKSIDSNGTQTTLTSGYTIEIRNSSNTVIDHSQAFGEGGVYNLKVSYKNFEPQIIPLTVAGGTFNPIVTIAGDGVTGTYNTSDTFASFLSNNADWGCLVEYSNEDLDMIAYDDFADNDINFYLINPSGITHNVNNAFGVEGTWKVKFEYNLDKSIFDEAEFEVGIVPVQTISLDKGSVTLEEGEQVQLQVNSITPNDATHKTYTWSSTSTSVATVSETGLVTAVATGTCKIKATATDGSDVYGECDITVVEQSNITYTFTTKEWNASPANWSSGKDGAGYNNGGVQVTSGATGANATSPRSFNNVTKVTINYCTNKSDGAGTIQVKVGSTTIATTSVSKSGGTTPRDMVFTPSSVVNGAITITVACSSNSIYIRSCAIEVGPTPVYPTAISLSNSTASVGISETTSIDVAYTPANTNIKNLTWSTDNSAIATVSNGIVTGISEGVVTITCTAAGANSTIVTDTIDITVHEIPVTSVSISPTSLEVYKGTTGYVSATVSPANATNQTVCFSSSNSSIAEVDNNGIIYAKEVGSVTITASSLDGGKTATCSVTVIAVPSMSKTHIQQTYQDYNDNYYYNCDCTPTSGNPKILIIPIWFTDSTDFISTSKKDNVKSDLQKAFFGTNEETGWRSVRTYYEELSNNTLHINGTVADWYECGQSSTTFNNSDTISLVKTAANNYFTTHPSDSKFNYDTDSDGFLDGVVLVYGAPDFQSGSTNENLWAYCAWDQDSIPDVSNPVPNVLMWESYDMLYGSTNVVERTGHDYCCGDTRYTSIDTHTIIHETGHALALEDYYDYSYTYGPAGDFSMQDCNVGSHDPYSVMAEGWADPYIPTSSCSIELHPFQTTHELILLTPSWNSYNSPFDEYLLLELYTPTGLNAFDVQHQYCGMYPKGSTETGIRLWHVDARLCYVYEQSGHYYISHPGQYSVTDGWVHTAMSNSYQSGDHGSFYAKAIGNTSEEYKCYNLNQLIRNNPSETYLPQGNFNDTSLFKSGSSFDMTTYGGQFYHNGKLNSNVSLGWSFSVIISGSGDSAVATVTCTKN